MYLVLRGGWLSAYAFYIADLPKLRQGEGEEVSSKTYRDVSCVVFSRDIQFFEQTDSEGQTIWYAKEIRTTEGKQSLKG